VDSRHSLGLADQLTVDSGDLSRRYQSLDEACRHTGRPRDLASREYLRRVATIAPGVLGIRHQHGILPLRGLLKAKPLPQGAPGTAGGSALFSGVFVLILPG
jgi:hypothetical protein